MSEPATFTPDRGYAGLPIPFGWFAVAMSGELGVGEIKTLRYFAREFVVWRGDDGAVRAIDPYCPHLGAHLGVGSTVQGNDLQCVFHHWSFDGEGRVTNIPYTKVIPPRLRRPCTSTWPVTECDGVIFVWYHPNRAAPKWDVVRVPECPAETPGAGWVLAETHDWVIGIHCQEITENGQDYAHFGAVHGVQGPPAGEFEMKGWGRHSRVVAEMVTPRGPMTGIIDVRALGPGQSMAQYIDVTHVVQSQQVTPIDAEHCHLRWQLYHLPDLSDGKMRVTLARMRDLVKQVNQDIPIWNAKTYHTEPLLVQGDGPILAYRRGYQRFYEFDQPEAETAAA